MFCTKCGTKLEHNESICHACGSDIDQGRILDLQNPREVEEIPGLYEGMEIKEGYQTKTTNKLYNKKLVGGVLLILFMTCMLFVGVRYYKISQYNITIGRVQITQYPMLAMEVMIEGELDDILDPEDFLIGENGKEVNLVGFKPISLNRYLIEFAPDNLDQGGEIVNVEVIIKIDGIKHKGSVQYETPENPPKWHTT